MCDNLKVMNETKDKDRQIEIKKAEYAAPKVVMFECLVEIGFQGSPFANEVEGRAGSLNYSSTKNNYDI